MRLALTLVVGLFGSIVFGCLWDRDTVAMELKGMPEIQDVIAGRFERNPDLFYEMRLVRIEKKSEYEFPGDYFDAAVALDRLGRSEEAIALIEGRLDPVMARMLFSDEASYNDVSYKRAANLGTFYIHRGLKFGDRGLADLKKGLALIDRAIGINPDAHFGREKVQAVLVKDIISEMENGKGIKDTGLTTEEIREGVIGLMVLGNAWESERACSWLAGSLDRTDSHVYRLIALRVKEIMGKAGKMGYPGAVLKLKLPEPLLGVDHKPADEERVDEIYLQLRDNGKKWVEKRDEFMISKLESGEHPDTDPGFWNGYEEVPPVVIKDRVGDKVNAWWSNPKSKFFVVFGVLSLCVVGAFVRSKRKGASQ